MPLLWASEGDHAMKGPECGEPDLQIGRARLVLSILAAAALYVDPKAGGLFGLSGAALATVSSYLIYSLAIYLASSRGLAAGRLAQLSTVLDLLFAAAIASCTGGAAGPSFLFFLFAIAATGFRTGFRATLVVTLGAVAMYLAVIGFGHGLVGDYAMRAVYLALAGCLMCFFGRERAALEARSRALESRAERLAIARSLHDGYVQTLAGVNLRLETCRALLSRREPALALGELSDLQGGVAREYDTVRSYVRSLAGIDRRAVTEAPKSNNTRFEMKADFSARGTVVEQVFQIALEGIRNSWRHGRARVVKIDVRSAGGMIHLTVGDDGAGFRDSSAAPWTIASRVAEAGGELRIASAAGSGATLEIQMPVG
jgi:signal transduction histidine kinase